jgi:hypothetical protein
MAALRRAGSPAAAVRKGIASVREWEVWTLRVQARIYLTAVIVVAAIAAAAATARATL